MPVLKYTLIKYAKSYSTWIIFIISFFIIMVLGGWIGLGSFRDNTKNAPLNYVILSVLLVAGITSFLAIFISIFAGFKAATMFKDEVEDGTFLVMLSKPITRTRIIFEKWLALMIAQVFYAFFLAFTFLLAILIFDQGAKLKELSFSGIEIKTLKSQALGIAGVLWGILIVMTTIFSSIAILASTKMSVGATIGLSIGIGVIIPVTGIIGNFTKEPSHISIVDKRVAFLTEIEPKAEGTNKVPTMYEIGVFTKEEDKYRTSWLADIKFQIDLLASLASTLSIPEDAKNIASGLSRSKGAIVSSGGFVKNNNFKNLVHADNTEFTNHEFIDQLFINSWEVLEPKRSAFIDIFKRSFRHEDKIQVKLSPSLRVAFSELGLPLPLDGYLDPELLKKFIDFDHKSDTASKEATYYMAVLAFAKFYEFTKPEFSDKVNNTIKAIEDLFPWAFAYTAEQLLDPFVWFDRWRMEAFVNDKNIKTDSTARPNNPERSPALAMIDENMFDDDTYELITSLSRQGYHVTKIVNKEYANKYNILYFYIAIGLLLLPISFLVVRKQDFR